MESCNAVERELDKVITNFNGINEHSERTLRDLTNHIEALKKEIDESKFRSSINRETDFDSHCFFVPVIFEMFIFIFTGPPDHELTAAQILIMKQTVNKVKESVHRLAAEHRDLHGTVSRVGKAIDRVKFLFFSSMYIMR